MSQAASMPSQSAIAMLRRMAQPRATQEHCEFCNIPIAPVHRHLLESAPRKVVCACDPCALRFQDVVGGRFKLIPRDARSLRGFQMTDSQWESFALPINLTFFYFDSLAEKIVALYPSPAGATESLLPATNWKNLAAENPALNTMQPDVEALLVNRIGAKRDYFIAPMDACYELVGLIRMHWRGLSGGETVWQEIDRFFANLRTGATDETQTPREAAHA
jgi:hypothetical protein